MTHDRGSDLTARLAVNLEAMASILESAYSKESGSSLRRWADALYRRDGWCVLQYLDAQTALGRYDEPNFADGRFHALLVESDELARALRDEAENPSISSDIAER